MLKNIAALSGASILFATLAVASTNSKADQACRGYHGPNWEAVLDDNGDPDDCRMITKEKKCFPTLDSETKKWVCWYVWVNILHVKADVLPSPAGTKAVSDSQTGVSACCGTDQSLSVDPQSKTGGCCEYGSHWSHNIKVEKGSCCKPGYDFNGLYCFETYPKPPHPSPTTGLTSTHVGECLMVCPAGVVASTTSSPTPSPLPTDIHTGKGFPQCDHDGSGKCLGMNLHPWQTGRDVILAGSSVQLPPIQWEWAGGYRPVDSGKIQSLMMATIADNRQNSASLRILGWPLQPGATSNHPSAFTPMADSLGMQHLMARSKTALTNMRNASKMLLTRKSSLGKG